MFCIIKNDCKKIFKKVLALHERPALLALENMQNWKKKRRKFLTFWGFYGKLVMIEACEVV